ncbi:hypothetical protein BS17DRAFT_794694 [Gyrodon lividus]|nr:hypothetical protein BS17DRAFT_794694 [Gyrodon lividus]
MPPKSSSPSASKWRQFIHPEGQPYFLLNHEEFAIVTEANLEDPETEGQFISCLELVKKELQYHNIKLPPRCELFLELRDDRTLCNYYFVDHAAKGLFWIEDLGTDLLDISAAMSPSHLGRTLERLYWAHLEFFPMHHELNEQASIFPYTADTCRQFLKFVSRQRARLASAILNQQFISFYQQESAQLDSRHETRPAHAWRHRWLSNIANLMLWGIPGYYNGLLEDLCAHDHPSADQWTQFMSLCLAAWTRSLVSVNQNAARASICLANVREDSLSTAIPLIISCTLTVISALCLDVKLRRLAEASASIGERYLKSVKSTSVGFLPLAVVFSLPQAGYMWAIGFFVAQVLSVAWRSPDQVVVLVVLAFLILSFASMWVTLPGDAGLASLLNSCVSSVYSYIYPSTNLEDESIV